MLLDDRIDRIGRDLLDSYAENRYYTEIQYPSTSLLEAIKPFEPPQLVNGRGLPLDTVSREEFTRVVYELRDAQREIGFLLQQVSDLRGMLALPDILATPDI